MRCSLSCLLLVIWSGSGLAEEASAVRDEVADTAKDKTELASAAAEEEEFKPPPGFVTKKRGKVVLYCMRDSTVGTRFKTEKCYDEAQLRDYLIAREENKRDMDRTRGICSNPTICAPQ